MSEDNVVELPVVRIPDCCVINQPDEAYALVRGRVCCGDCGDDLIDEDRVPEARRAKMEKLP